MSSNTTEDTSNSNNKNGEGNEDYDLEEAKDTVACSLPASVPRDKMFSDITGMGGGRRRSKTVSDISDLIIAKHLPAPRPRQRQKSSADVLIKFGQANVLKYEDLKLADKITALGTRTERLEQGISDHDFKTSIEEKEQYEKDFPFNTKGLTSEEAEKRLQQYGRNELPEKRVHKWLVFLRLFWAPMPIMIWLAIIIELGIGNYIDMAILLVIQFSNASISFYESNKAGNAIAALRSSLKPAATCKRDGKWQVLDAALLVPGDTVLLGSGSAIPADCRVNHSEIDVDQAALTGESLPVTFYKGDSCKMGSTVVRGEVEVCMDPCLLDSK